MRILIAPNTLRGSLDAFQAAEAIGRGIRRAAPQAELCLVPIADGGDRTASVLARACGGEMVEADVVDPLGRPSRAAWGLLPDGTAVIDVAAASGLGHLAPMERDPMHTSSFGTGQLVRAALDRGCRRLIIGLGGSATVDGGTGLLNALGASFLTKDGQCVPAGGQGLLALDHADLSELDARLARSSITVACDVESPLVGPEGAARVFGPQKGATPEMVALLERGLENVASRIEAQSHRTVRSLPRGGAAGGIAAALHGWLGAELVSGIDLVLGMTRFFDELEASDLVVTSEGMLDGQTLAHKGPYGVAQAARRHGVPVMVLAGGIDDTVTSDRFSSFDALLSICMRPVGLSEAMCRAAVWLESAAEQATRLLLLGASIATPERSDSRGSL